ncbi:hypothetical protein [Ammonifex thiophilus]|uniref:Uncharacterized protein n=1 Tax=Ammonifex thiophilus TaxID=444093 RepID=A0A3D8P5J5_9THEO|nr:hypothetical protein [Ammonifex thiophilus]RDV83573.1 hypothetical protein DXX99_04550 [Ammonifex thiophilus]
MQGLSAKDLDFVLRTVVDKRDDYGYLQELLHDKPDLVDLLLDDPKLFRRIVSEEDVLLKISPYLFFEVLLRQARKELSHRRYTVERVGIYRQVPVLDGTRVGELLGREDVRGYLANLLASFTKTNTAVFYFKVGTRLYKRRYSDLDVDDLLGLVRLVEEPYRYPLYRRIGEVCLFLSAVFPDYIEEKVKEHFMRATRVEELFRCPWGVEEYTTEGERYYRLAASLREKSDPEEAALLRTVADNFLLLRKSLNHIAENYLCFRKAFSLGS